MIERIHPLRQKIQLVSPYLEKASRRAWSHPKLKDFYPDLLISFHWMIRASVPLMEAARNRACAMDPQDRLAAQLADYLTAHIPEEMNHDEWLLEDLEVLGVSRAEALERIPSPTMASLVGCQYYWIFHAHPVALLGYIAVLEGNPPTEKFLKEIIGRTGIPRAAFRSLFKHAQLDPRHRDDLDEVLTRLPLTPEHSALLGVSAFTTVHLFGQSFEEFVELHQ